MYSTKCITSIKNNNVNTYTSGLDDHTESIVAFHHADSAWVTKIDSEMDPTRDSGYYGDADLSDYLQRPVRILDSDWTVTAGTFSTVINPWSLFLENTQVKNRVEGYRLLQGNLNIRIAINGGPFFYGRAIAAYHPQHEYNDHSFGSTTGEYYKQQLTMLPHTFLDPTSSEGGEIVCPFLCPDNWLDMIGGTYEHMGQLRICSLNDLLHANSSTGKVNISVYAWMTNVRLAAPTTRTYGTFNAQVGTEAVYGAAGVSVLGAALTWMRYFKCSFVGGNRSLEHEVELPPGHMEAQAGDEYGTGIVSKPASAIAKVAGSLANIPVIKPFARPTEMIAGTIGRIAHIFGYSRPTIVSDLVKMKNKAAGNMANTDAHEAVTKLTLDSKQELSIDPRTVGLSDVDEMAFNYIKQKECYLSTIEWDESQVGDTELGDYAIGPDMHNREVINSSTLHLLAPMYTVAAPFKYWRGSIKLRFQIAASQMHRGRIRISYDPYLHDGTPGENETYSRIIDLATNRDFEMLVAWNNPKGWLRVQNRLANATFGHPVTGTVVFDPETHNGHVRVEVVNELTSPNPSLAQPVYINVYASAGEDFEVADPTDSIMSLCEYEPQSGFEAQSGTEGEEMIDEKDNIPESPAPITSIGREELPDNPNSHVYFGESFASVRALLKRYTYHTSYYLGQCSHAWWPETNFPVEPGQAKLPRSITKAGEFPDGAAYNYTAMTYLNWFTPCYVGFRGGLRSKYTSVKPRGYFNIRRTSEPISQGTCFPRTYEVTKSADATPYELWGLLRSTAGNDVTIMQSDGCAEVEFPFYCNKRFAPARKFLFGAGTVANSYLGENAGHVVTLGVATTGEQHFVNRYVAAGDDFSLFMWIGQPGLVYRAKPEADGSSLTVPSF